MVRTQRVGRHLDDHLADFQPDGTGRVEKIAGGQAQARVPHRRIDEKHQAGAIHVGQPRMRGERRREQRAQSLIEGVEPEGATDRIAATAGEQRIECGARPAGTRWQRTGG